MSKRDYYDVLGVSKDASDEVIKKSYRALAKKYHPDVSKEPNAEAKFKEVQEAYDTISDPQKRRQYDQFGHDGPQAGGFDFSGFGGGFSDIFESFFGGGTRSSRNTNRAQKGNDLEKIMTLEFEEAIFGCNKEIKINVNEECSTCGGSGAYSKSDVVTCERCKGTGTIITQQQTIFGMAQSQSTCPKCGGKGKEIKRKCQTCNGTTRIQKVKDIEIKVPAGVNEGLSMRLEQKGEAGYNGGPNGDLYITFKVKQHKVFVRENDNILLTIPISFAQAALGDSIEVPTVYGETTLKIPSGTQSGTKFRIKDKGVANVRNGNKGDQFVTVNVQTPTNLTTEQKKLFEELNNLDGKTKESPWEKFKKKFKN